MKSNKLRYNKLNIECGFWVKQKDWDVKRWANRQIVTVQLAAWKMLIFIAESLISAYRVTRNRQVDSFVIDTLIIAKRKYSDWYYSLERVVKSKIVWICQNERGALGLKLLSQKYKWRIGSKCLIS